MRGITLFFVPARRGGKILRNEKLRTSNVNTFELAKKFTFILPSWRKKVFLAQRVQRK